MDVKELRAMGDVELHKYLKQQREHMRDLRFKVHGKQHKDVRELREVKKTIARILTVITDRGKQGQANRTNTNKRT